jgi:hypothetical protein
VSKSYKPTIDEIIALRWDLESTYAQWHAQQADDDRFYNVLYAVSSSLPPDAFEQVRPPSAAQIIDMAADHSAGNSPRLHVPRRKETAKAQSQTSIMEKAGVGFWYRNIAKAKVNPLRAWAQSGALRGAICASLFYDGDAWPDKPLPSKLGGIESADYKAAYDNYEALCADAWPFNLNYEDPMYAYPDPATEGNEYVILAFKRKAYEVKRAHPSWNYILAGQSEPCNPNDELEFISYADKEYRAYIVAGVGQMSKGRGLLGSGDGVVKHGYGFVPYFFIPGGYGSPFGSPEHRYSGLITKARDLLKLEARRMTHLDAIIAQQAFPWIVHQQGVQANMELMGVTVVPPGTKVQDAITELRPSIPIQEIVMELQAVRAALQRATLPDSLASEPSKSDESGYLRAQKIATGRSRVRSLTDALDRTCEWATSGFYRLVENKVKAPVSTWGKGMDANDEFVTISPKDINGHYEVYCTLAPSLPQDESTDIANGLKLYQSGAIPIRDLLETYAGRENPEELLTERLGEDVLKSPPMLQQMVMDAMAVTGVTGGPIAVPGFASGNIGVDAGANPASNAGVGAARSIPTPPAAPGSLQATNNVIGRNQRGGLPQNAPR